MVQMITGRIYFSSVTQVLCIFLGPDVDIPLFLILFHVKPTVTKKKKEDNLIFTPATLTYFPKRKCPQVFYPKNR